MVILMKLVKVAWISLKKNKETNDNNGIARDYSNIGQILKDKGNLDEALKYGKMALEIQTELNDRVGMAIDYNNIATILQVKGHTEMKHSNMVKWPLKSKQN